jgi:hypothetical protein
VTLAQNCAPLPLPRAAKQALALASRGMANAMLGRGGVVPPSPQMVEASTWLVARHLGAVSQGAR